MSRLLAFLVAIIVYAQPAAAEVCEKVLGTGFERLMKATLLQHVGDQLMSPATLVLIAIAILTATKMPRLRGLALIATLVTAVQAVTAIGANVFPDQLMLAARIEGCGEASIAAAIVSSGLTLLLAASFIVAPDATDRRPRA